MSKRNKLLVKAGTVNVNISKTELGRGKITGNFLGALVTSTLYKMQVVKAKKGKGSFQRKAKNARGESYLMMA